MEKQTEQEKTVLQQFAKSYLYEEREMMQNMLDYMPELDKRIDMEGLETGVWSWNSSEWKLNDGTVFDSTRLIINPPVNFIRALLSSDFLSLFEVIFLIGRATNNPTITCDSTLIAITAIAKNIVSPRNPDTNLKIWETPSIHMNGELITPNLSWLLSFEEAESWAINSFGVSLIELRDKLAKEQPVKPSPDAATNENAELTDRERDKLLKIIGLLAETLADTKSKQLRNEDGSIIFGNGEMGKTGKTNLLHELNNALEKINQSRTESPIKGLGTRTLRNVLEDAVKALHDNS